MRLGIKLLGAWWLFGGLAALGMAALPLNGDPAGDTMVIAGTEMQIARIHHVEEAIHRLGGVSFPPSHEERRSAVVSGWDDMPSDGVPSFDDMEQPISPMVIILVDGKEKETLTGLPDMPFNVSSADTSDFIPWRQLPIEQVAEIRITQQQNPPPKQSGAVTHSTIWPIYVNIVTHSGSKSAAATNLLVGMGRIMLLFEALLGFVVGYLVLTLRKIGWYLMLILLGWGTLKYIMAFWQATTTGAIAAGMSDRVWPSLLLMIQIAILFYVATIKDDFVR